MVQAQCSQTNEIFELIPSEILEEDLPDILVVGHVHWLNLSTSIIEIRPRDKLWEQTLENWRIDCAAGLGQSHGYKGYETLLDIRSPTWTLAPKYFNHIIDAMQEATIPDGRHLLVTAFAIAQSRSEKQLSVVLPHWGLSFFVNECEELESRDFKDMVYDEVQSVGTLFGLREFLVLRPKTHLAGVITPEGLIPRRILIPNGISKKSYQGQIFIDTHHSWQLNEPSYHAYNVDSELGCLTGNSSLTSMRSLANLHATTTLYRPDPLTGKTGAQAAICLLRSAVCRSVMKLKALSGDENSDKPNPWSSTVYPQLNAAHDEIQNGYYWYKYDAVGGHRAPGRGAECASRRAGHLFPPDVTKPVPRRNSEDEEHLIPGLNQELEDIVSAAASAVYHWTMVNKDPMSSLAERRSSINRHAGVASPSLQHSGSRIWSSDSESHRVVLALVIQASDIMGKREETHQQFAPLFLLPMVAYRSPCHQTAFLSMLVEFAIRMKSRLDLPSYADSCKVSDGYRPTKQMLQDHIQEFRIETPSMYHELEWLHADVAIEELLLDWPCQRPAKLSFDPRYWDVAGLSTSLQQLFSRYFDNWNLKEDLIHVLVGHSSARPPYSASPVRPVPNEHASFHISLDQLLSDRPVPQLPRRNTLPRDSIQDRGASGPPVDIPELDQLFSSLQIGSTFQQQYIALLETSAGTVRKTLKHRTMYDAPARCGMDALLEHYEQCRGNYMAALDILKKSLGPTTAYEQTLEQFGHWPAITGDNLLRCLASTSPISLQLQWKQCLVLFALLLLELQRAKRLLQFALDGLEEEFLKELESKQCDGWDPMEYPDWLLIQVQGNFLIRRTQAETAMQMISPLSGQNTVMQVNMGEGKSSVIIPIVSAALADGKKLVRVIVPKELTVQMFEILVSRLGGLANRPVYHLPFSRTPEYEDGNVISPKNDDIFEIMSRCMAERGVLLVQPEHVVSLKLMAVEEQIHKGRFAPDPYPNLLTSVHKHISTSLSLASKLLAGDSLVGSIFQYLTQLPIRPGRRIGSAQAECYDEQSDIESEDVHDTLDRASKWTSLQKWMHSNVRDILDESDDILSSRFQLVYTIGVYQHMDGYPNRWIITQQVLRLVKDHAHTLSQNHPSSVEYECGPPGSFPHVHLVRDSDVCQRLISMIVEDVMNGRLSSLDFQHLPTALHDAIRSFLSDVNVLQVTETVKSVEEYATRYGQNHLWKGLLLLRGLLASNILLFALSERRWRVDYGPDLPSQADRRRTITMLAVPYRAKDVPSRNTQFGHPDLTIILTCLSYYYSGLTEAQLRISFEMLIDQDESHKEYALWVKEYDRESVPVSVRQLSNMNLRSSEQWDKVIYPLFSRNQAAIDFYLARVVFPKEAKEFLWKLCGSSWDLGEKRENLITGFSGTNDGRWLLPMSVTQCDLDHQRGTNAKVLAHLLQPENASYMVTHKNGERQTALEFLRLVTLQHPKIRVLLDVGAQILDSSNLQVARTWLSNVRDAAGAIYFDENNELTVLTRNDTTQPLSSLPLSQQLESCLVYLDHAHTIGTDLKLPIGSRAAVTLGSKVTKDSLVQGCMRMRMLGYGHSVMFFAPPGVDQSIRAVKNLDPNSHVTTVDILCWAIHETWNEIQQRAPYWVQQGMNHKERHDAWSRFCRNEITPEQLSDTWLQPDAKSLSDLYAPREAGDTSIDLSAVPGMQQRCKDLGVLSLPRGQLEEEQEREVSHEREREREVELPPRAKPTEHFLHPDVVFFVRTGIIPPQHSETAFVPVFASLKESSAATREVDVWSSPILATEDFCRTIDPESTKGTMDQYLRPVQWILSHTKDHSQVLVLLSPFEADYLMPDIRVSKHVHLHLYAPRTSKRMRPSDDLRLYAIPPLPSDWTPPWDLIDQLNVFSGQLYLRDYQSYLRLCRFLGVPTEESPIGSGIQRNLFNIPGSLEEMEVTFADSPLPSVMALLSIRNRGRPFDRTHMGKILRGQPLTENDFEMPPTSVVFDHNPTMQTLDDDDDDVFPSPYDMVFNAQDYLTSSNPVLVRSREQELDTAANPEVDGEPAAKRPRIAYN